VTLLVAAQPAGRAARAAVPYSPGAERSPVTAFARQFIEDCEGERWLLDETERLLNMKQASIDCLAPDMLEDITSLGLRDRGIAGRIPKAIGYFTGLTELLMSGNRLSGELSEELYTLAKLKNVDLSDNLYQGFVPAGFARLPSLETLRLSENGYTGAIPIALTAAAAPGDLPATLRLLDLSGNRLTGGVIPALSNLSRLEFLDLSRNGLGGEIPPAITGLSRLEVFFAWDCSLEGSIPAGIGDMSALKYLDLSENALAGDIPAGVSRLTGMRELSLAGNELTGVVPDAFSGMSALEAVHIDRNNLRGHIPDSLLAAFENGAAVSFSRNYMTGPNALAIESGSEGKAAMSSGNFLDGSAGQQYRLAITTPLYQYFPATGQAINLYPLLRNITARGGGGVPKLVRPVSEYAVTATPPALAGLIKISTGAGFIDVTLLSKIPYASGAAVEIQIRDNYGSEYSKATVRVGGDLAPAPQGGVGGGGLEAGAASQSAVRAREEVHVPYIAGYEDGSVRPDRAVSREEAATMLYRIYGGAEPAAPVSYTGFTDVAADRWSAPRIEAVRKEKLMTGYPDGGFKPAGFISRNEFAALLCRISGKELTGDIPEGFALTDVPGGWAAPYVYAAYGAGYITGYEDGTFRGGGSVSRAEAAAMLNRVLSRRPDETYWEGAGSPYVDIDESHWAYYEILEASEPHTHVYTDLFPEAGEEDEGGGAR
jgi:hypothetical protein